jgi:hypothetical protein
MKTVVQTVRRAHSPPLSEIVHGTPDEVLGGSQGPISIFGPGQVVAFRLTTGFGQRLFVFRTLAADDPLEAQIPGVYPQTRILFSVTSADRVRRVRGLFRHLVRHGPSSPSAIGDDFYVRVGAVLGGRLPSAKILPSLLARDHDR